jgi:hypothetical protein
MMVLYFGFRTKGFVYRWDVDGFFMGWWLSKGVLLVLLVLFFWWDVFACRFFYLDAAFFIFGFGYVFFYGDCILRLLLL